jgi:asparagine synthase (glutamine-hydrolysing)
VTKLDRATMAFGEEARSPLLDEDLWAYVAGIPRAMLLDPRLGKKILRRAYEGVLPGPVLTRSKKGFSVPIAAWMRSQLRPAVQDLLLGPDDPVGGLLRPDPTRRLVHRFLDGDDRLTARTWNLLALAGWNAARTRTGSLAGSR